MSDPAEIAPYVDLWILEGLDLSDQSLDPWWDLLSESERRVADRYRRAEDRRRSILGRGLARQALAHRTGIPAAEIPVVVDDRGRPLAVDTDLCFSVSHTHGLVGVAVSECEVGFDAEWLGRTTDVDLVARRWFHPDEVRAIRAREGEAQRQRFFTVWTLKEAYCKALGLGLAVPLKSLNFEIDERAVELTRDDESVRGWGFQVLRHLPSHVVSVAVEAPQFSLRLL